MKWFFSIRTKLFALVFFASAILVAVIYWQIGAKADAVAERTVERSLQQSDTILQTRIESRFLFIKEVVQGFANDGRIRPLVYEQESLTLQDLSSEYEAVYGFNILFFLNAEGTILARSDDPDAIGFNLAGRTSLFDDALAGQLSTGFITSQGKLMQTVAAPILDNVATDLVKGAVVLAYELSPQIAQEIVALTESHIGFFAFTRDDNFEIDGIEKSYVTDEAVAAELSAYFQSNPQAWQNILASETDALRETQIINGQLKHSIYRKVSSKDGNPLGFVVALRADQALKQPFQEIQQQLLMSGGVGLLLASIFAGLMAIGVSRPIIRLVEIIKQVQGGAYPDDDSKTSDKDEVGLLNNAIVNMAQSLREKAELEAYLAELADEVKDGSSIQLSPEVAALTSVSVSEDKTVFQPSSEAGVVTLTSYPDDILDARFKLLSELGTGAMGSVYLANDLELNEKVALKVMQKDLFEQLDGFNFKQEIRLARKITHRNIVRTFDFGTWQDITYITMEYVQGYDLGRLLKKKGALDLNIGLAVCKQICSAMLSAHQMGVIHRDLKPSNMIINRQGILKIMDFGLAMQVKNEQGQQVSGESSGQIMGTPRFMAPEQFSLKGEFDVRTDIYSMGVIMFTLFNGSPPFSAKTLPEVAEMHRTVQVPEISGKNQNLPANLRSVIHTAMAKKPQDRFQSVREMFDQLNA